jgi:hypothetical protein
MYGGVEVKLQTFSNSALVGGDWSVLRFSLFISLNKRPRYPSGRDRLVPQGGEGETKLTLSGI